MMKKYVTAVFAAAAFAAASFSAVGADDVKVVLNGSELSFDVAPEIVSDRTFVPMRAIFEAMGAEVEWNGGDSTVTAVNGETTVKMTIGSDKMYSGEREITLDAAPFIENGRTLAPVRAVAEGFGAEVLWDNDARTVIITYDTNIPSPEPSVTPEPSEALNCPIDVSDIASHEVNGFEITDWKLNSDGNYEITYTLRTFKEGSGSIEAMFDCLDSSGKAVDSFGGFFKCTDYTWTIHTETAVISSKTVKIQLRK